METNDFLLYNEIIYHIHTCQDMDDLKRSILAQVKLMIPYTYASLIVVEIDPETREIRHSDQLHRPGGGLDRPGSPGRELLGQPRPRVHRGPQQ